MNEDVNVTIAKLNVAANIVLSMFSLKEQPSDTAQNLWTEACKFLVNELKEKE